MDLPQEAIAEIISWLPVKSLLRFRCVSKTWLHLLSFDSGFIKLHLDRSIESNKNKNPSIMVSHKEVLERTRFYYVEDYTSCDKAIMFYTPFSNPSLAPNLSSGRYNDFRVVNFCNGLLCMTDFYDADCSNVYVWNPLTGDHVTIPCPPIPSAFPLSDDGFLDSKTDVVFGFGFDRDGDEYKIVRVISVSVWERLLPFQSHVCVYTLGTNSWRIIDEIAYNIKLKNDDETAFVNGAIHWFVPKVETFTWDRLVSFDITDEVFREIPPPNIRSCINEDDTYDTIVGELGGLLCISCRVYYEEIQIWVMKEYGVVDSWMLQFRFGQPGMPPLDPLAIANNGEIVIRKDLWQLILYNPWTNSIRNLHKFCLQIYYARAYVGSLVSPTMISGATHIDDVEDN